MYNVSIRVSLFKSYLLSIISHHIPATKWSEHTGAYFEGTQSFLFIVLSITDAVWMEARTFFSMVLFNSRYFRKKLFPVPHASHARPLSVLIYFRVAQSVPRGSLTYVFAPVPSDSLVILFYRSWLQHWITLNFSITNGQACGAI